jgi:hypothetical protein
VKPLWVDKSTRTQGFAALSFALLIAYADNCAAGSNVPLPVGPPPAMTIVIYNNAGAYNIYPVLSTGTTNADKWLQAAAKVPHADTGRYPYPNTSQFRFYINPTGDGIPPGGSVTITLPLYTQMVPTASVNPSVSGQYIDWWNGGRIEIFDSLAATHKPPLALTADYTGTNPYRSRQKEVKSAATNPVLPTLTKCTPSPCQSLKFFSDPAGLKTNEPSQLTEYTLGALNDKADPYVLDYHTVDYDVSYVDAAYLPAAMEPFNNDQVGYVGSIQSIAFFKQALQTFLTQPQYKGWPKFKDDQGTIILKVPSPLHILPGDPDMSPQGPWAPITTLANNWKKCTQQGGTATICPLMVNVSKLFQKNYNFCGMTGKVPDNLMLQHVYGWQPFGGATSCLLQDTPGYWTLNPDKTRNYSLYEAVKKDFDLLQYWIKFDKLNGEFDPYVLLIHGGPKNSEKPPYYINAPTTYAYSVDDALGNMLVKGDGLIIAVGGPQRLPNQDEATPPVNVGIGWGPANKINFTHYGACTLDPKVPVNPTYASFAISATNLSKCPISFVDNKGEYYYFKLKSQPPYPVLPPAPQPPAQANYAPIDCSLNKAGGVGAKWCKTISRGVVVSGVFAHTVPGLLGSKTDSHYAITPAPAQPPSRQ